ncbi:Nucleic acid-binding protein [Corchorus olitorius]|uniref:Nucleic acid-binding protein n=1 Tax=Corchorus olitorius TaxID=93759 RepID=A0A1R3GP84_9ROSI|nr:Nucleic acid-binding protein [Corchorus olitorius]
MDSPCKKRVKVLVKLFHCTLGKLKPGLRAFIVARVARMWETILPDVVVPIRSDLLLIDHDGSSMHAIILQAVARFFGGKIVEGCVYKFTRFDTVNCRLSYLAVPSDYIIYFNSSTSVEEITESINFDYPRYCFRFASMEDLRARNEKDRVLTDIVGMLTVIGSRTSVNRASGNSSTERRDILIKLLSDDDIRVNFWGLHVGDVDEEFLMTRPSNPVMVITAGIVKEYNSVKYISSSSATKVYVDINVPKTVQLKQRFDGVIPPVKLLAPDESQSIDPVASPTDISIDELFYLSLDDLRGQRYRIEGKIVEINNTNGWFYESCPKCKIKLVHENGKFSCNDDGVVTPEFVMQLNLIVQDETAKIEVVMFGKQAEELVGVPLTRSIASQCLDKTKLPATAKDPTGSEIEYVFIIGITEQTYKRGLKKFKVYSYSAKEEDHEPVVLDKGKKVLCYSGNEVMQSDGCEKGTSKVDCGGVNSVDCNESVIAHDVVSTPQLHYRKREDSVPVDMPDSPCIPHDLFDTDSPNKKSRKDQDCREI